MSGYDKAWFDEHQTSAMPIEVYNEVSAGIYRAMGWTTPAQQAGPVAIPLDDQPCNLCGGAGELRDDSGYGFATITTCACAGTGSRAHIITERTTK